MNVRFVKPEKMFSKTYRLQIGSHKLATVRVVKSYVWSLNHY